MLMAEPSAAIENLCLFPFLGKCRGQGQGSAARFLPQPLKLFVVTSFGYWRHLDCSLLAQKISYIFRNMDLLDSRNRAVIGGHGCN